jgi:uncharacterized membrane protein YhaH (DUF805 family)
MAGDTFGALLYNPALAGARWALLATSLPFLWAGVALTIRRLRSAGLPAWLVVVFFMPGLNFLMFVILMILPPRPDTRAPGRPSDPLLGRLIPRSALGSALAAMVLTFVPIGVLILLGTQWFRQYGWGLWSDAVIHRIHGRVLRHVKRLAEEKGA